MHGCNGAPFGRVEHGQGTDRSPYSRADRTAPHRVRGAELRGHTARAPGERIVRPRARRLYRRDHADPPGDRAGDVGGKSIHQVTSPGNEDSNDADTGFADTGFADTGFLHCFPETRDRSAPRYPPRTGHLNQRARNLIVVGVELARGPVNGTTPSFASRQPTRSAEACGAEPEERPRMRVRRRCPLRDDLLLAETTWSR